MKKQLLILTILLFFLLNITLSTASITISHECEDYRCKEGTDITYFINIRNNIDKEIDVNYIKVKNELDENIALYDEVKYRLLPNESSVFEITEKIPLPPLGGYTLDYYACFGVTIFYPDGTTAIDEVCGDVRKSLTVLPLSKIQCSQNSDCKSNEYCDVNFFKCREIKCSGFIVNHKCVNYFVVAAAIAVILVLLTALITLENKKLKKSKRKEKS